MSLLHCRRRIRRGGAAAVRGARVVSPSASTASSLRRFQITGSRNGAPVVAPQPPPWGASRKLARGHPATTPLGARDFFFLSSSFCSTLFSRHIFRSTCRYYRHGHPIVGTVSFRGKKKKLFPTIIIIIINRALDRLHDLSEVSLKEIPFFASSSSSSFLLLLFSCVSFFWRKGIRDSFFATSFSTREKYVIKCSVSRSLGLPGGRCSWEVSNDYRSIYHPVDEAFCSLNAFPGPA